MRRLVRRGHSRAVARGTSIEKCFVATLGVWRVAQALRAFLVEKLCLPGTPVEYHNHVTSHVQLSRSAPRISRSCNTIIRRQQPSGAANARRRLSNRAEMAPTAHGTVAPPMAAMAKTAPVTRAPCAPARSVNSASLVGNQVA